MLFVEEADLGRKALIEAWFASRLPPSFLGWSTHWGPPDSIGVRLLKPLPPGEPVSHRVEVMAPVPYFRDYLRVDPSAPLSDEEWLVPGDQKLRTIRYGKLFRDDLGLEKVRDRLAWYPEPVWREKMARLWDAIAEEEPFIGRCGDVGDDLGSRLVAARLVDHAVRLGLLQAKEYPPYSKWLGTALQRLPGTLGLLSAAVLTAEGWRAREAAFNALGAALIRAHNALGLTEPLPVEAEPFWGRPYRVCHGERAAARLRSEALTKS